MKVLYSRVIHETAGRLRLHRARLAARRFCEAQMGGGAASPRSRSSKYVKAYALALALYLGAVTARYFNAEETCFAVGGRVRCAFLIRLGSSRGSSPRSARGFLRSFGTFSSSLPSIASGIVSTCSRKSPPIASENSAKTRVAESVRTFYLSSRKGLRLLLAEFLALYRIGNVVSLCHGTWDADLVCSSRRRSGCRRFVESTSPSPFLSHS